MKSLSKKEIQLMEDELLLSVFQDATEDYKHMSIFAQKLDVTKQYFQVKALKEEILKRMRK